MMLALAALAHAAPLTLHHTGRLLDTTGTPLVSMHDVEVSVYDDSASATALWTDTFSVDFDQGYYAVVLGSATPLDSAIFDGSTRWIGLSIDGTGLPDRHEVTSVPYALVAATVEGPTLGDLSCPADRVALFDGSDWGCAPPAVWSAIVGVPADIADGDDMLDEAAVDLLVGNNGYALDADLAAVAKSGDYADLNGLPALFAGDWTDLSGIPADLADGDALLTEADVEAFIENGDLDVSGTVTVGGAAPTAALTVNGSIQVGDGGAVCDPTLQGTIRWTGTLQVCNGTSWDTLSTGFDPGSIPNLALWVHGDAGVVLNGSNVSQWVDQSGSGNHFAQSTANRQPQFVVGGLNGHNVLRHDGATDQALTVSTNFAPPSTVIYVARMTGGDSQRILAGLNNNWLLGWWSGAWDQAYHGGWVSSGSPTSGTTFRQYTSVMTGSLSTIYADGIELFSNNTGLTGPDGLSTGGQGSEHSNAEVAEILVYDRALTDLERQKIEVYLQTKYAL